jgi:hypothetical protein
VSDTAADTHIVCRDCDCAIDCCQFCDKEDCEKAVCYRCMIVALGQSIPDLHPHGG